MRCYRKILHISYKDHVTNEEVRAKIQHAIGLHEDLLTIVKRRKLQWYAHVSRSSGLAKTILQVTVKGGWRQSRQRKRWKTTSGNWQAWSSPSPRGQWRTGKMEKTGCKIICGAPTTLAVKELMMMMIMMMMIPDPGKYKIMCIDMHHGRSPGTSNRFEMLPKYSPTVIIHVWKLLVSRALCVSTLENSCVRKATANVPF